MTFFLLSDFPLSHALSSACSQAVLRAELDGAALDQIMMSVERMQLLRPRARTLGPNADFSHLDFGSMLVRGVLLCFS